MMVHEGLSDAWKLNQRFRITHKPCRWQNITYMLSDINVHVDALKDKLWLENGSTQSTVV